MVFTTNLSSAGSPMTYRELRAECGTLLQLAQAMESIAKGNGSFLDNERFQQLNREFKAALASVNSLGSVF